MCKILDEMGSWIDEIPRGQTPSRFGDPAFRVFLERLDKHAEPFMLRLLKDEAQVRYAREIGTYLRHSFGDVQRIDYGSGHEANFICCLLCLDLVGVFDERDSVALVLVVFNRYLRLMRRLQVEYRLEPAGSRGSWGLDDYHHLAFYWGAAQLIGHPHVRPKAARVKDMVDALAASYIYFDCMHFINTVKSCSLAEHSPLLSDITNVKTWDKVNSGLLKMYKHDVLSKFAVVQHFLFGELLTLDADEALKSAATAALEGSEGGGSAGDTHGDGACCHAQQHVVLDCCAAIRIPSAVPPQPRFRSVL